MILLLEEKESPGSCNLRIRLETSRAYAYVNFCLTKHPCADILREENESPQSYSLRSILENLKVYAYVKFCLIEYDCS